MSKLDQGRYGELMGDVSNNLKNEIAELSKKVSQARESENWGTYKNLVLAYKEIVKMYNDIAIDVCERDADKTQHIETTLSLDKNTSGIFAEAIHGMLTNNSELTTSGFVGKPTKSDIKSVNLFSEWDRLKPEIIDGSIMITVDTSKLLSHRLISCDEGTLINVAGFRAIGKTHELIKFAKEWNYLVIVSNEYLANCFKKEYDYEYIYSQKNNLLSGIEIKNCVVDEGVDVNRIKNELGLNIITGYTNKQL